MHAIILAAGQGTRLEGHNPTRSPKCLLEFGGKSLLQRHLEVLAQNRVQRVDLVVGHEADRVVDHIGGLNARPAVSFHFNPRFGQGSVLSVLAARETLAAGENVVLMDADVLYHPSILARLLESRHANCVLLDRNFASGEEPVKVAIRGGLMVEFRKRLAADLDYDQVGESVGFFRFDADTAATMALECERFETEGMADAPHEEAIRNLLLRRPVEFGFEDVTGLPWIEIDFPEDIGEARDRVLPAIRAEVPDF